MGPRTATASKRTLYRPSSSSAVEPSRSSQSTSAPLRCRSPMARGRSSSATASTHPSRIRRLEDSVANFARRPSHRDRMVVASASTSLPAGVRTTRRAERSNRDVPSALSSALTCLVTGGCVICSCSAARPKCSSFATATKTRNCCHVTSMPWKVSALLNSRIDASYPAVARARSARPGRGASSYRAPCPGSS